MIIPGINSIPLEKFGFPKRLPPRQKHLRQESYEDQFDYETLFYDIFANNDRLFLIGPSNDDDTNSKILNSIYINNEKINPNFYSSPKLIKIIIENFKKNDRLAINGLDIHVKNFTLKTAYGNTYAYTMSKDNNPEWIQDWIVSWNKHQGVTNFIINNNNSTSYTIEELNNYLYFENLNVYLFDSHNQKGPGAFNGSAWDSDFFQDAMIEIARYKYIGGNGYMFNFDIDEICENFNIIEFIEEIKVKVLKISGLWSYVDSIEWDAINSFEQLRHKHHVHHLFDKKCPTKWVADLNKLSDNVICTTHDVSIDYKEIHNEIQHFYSHCSGITNHWKWHRPYKIKIT